MKMKALVIIGGLVVIGAIVNKIAPQPQTDWVAYNNAAANDAAEERAGTALEVMLAAHTGEHIVTLQRWTAQKTGAVCIKYSATDDYGNVSFGTAASEHHGAGVTLTGKKAVAACYSNPVKP